MSRPYTLLIALMLGAASQSFAEEISERVEKMPPTQEEIDSVILLPSLQNGISFIGGGVGVVERKALEQWAKGYSLRIEMARKSGEYIGDMMVRVFDANGSKLIEARSDGPLMYIQLPAGRYAVDIDSIPASNGKARVLEPKIREVTIESGKQARLFFAWP